MGRVGAGVGVIQMIDGNGGVIWMEGEVRMVDGWGVGCGGGGLLLEVVEAAGPGVEGGAAPEEGGLGALEVAPEEVGVGFVGVPCGTYLVVGGGLSAGPDVLDGDRALVLGEAFDV